MIRKLALFVFVFFLLGAAAVLKADIRFELGFGWTLVGPSMNARYVNQYQPTLTPPDRYIASSAEQTVRFKGKTTYGMNGFFNVLFTENVGLQVLADYHRPGIGGASAPYDVSMQFMTFEPVTHVTSLEELASKGNLTQTTFSLNALARFRVADNLSISASAGPSVFHFEGQAGYIDYTYYNLAVAGGVYTLTGATYHMVVDFGPQTKYGVNVGVEAAYEAFRHVILAFDLRWYGAPKSDLQMHVVEDDLITRPIDEIEATIGLGALRVNPSYIRAGLAVRFIF
ncbi:MAG: hypothetical protein HGA24_07240 [Candidatus Aminicenantes bacterium]|nr:hypothetical protein [Candidatus Aminicenantes bacterium]